MQWRVLSSLVQFDRIQNNRRMLPAQEMLRMYEEDKPQ